MAPNFIVPNREQDFLMPPSLKDWLPEDDYAFFVIDAIERMDIAPFMANIRLDGRGGASYEPRMMVTLLVYAYSMGIRSSRKIEILCERDIAFRLICGNLSPDHTSIARFRQHHEDAIAALFGEVLVLCREAGMTKAGFLALDGTKIAGNASLAANKTEETLEAEIKKILDEAAAKDEEENRQYGTARGDELPEDLRKSESRKARLDACLKQIRDRKAAEAAEREDLLKRRREMEADGKKIRGRKPKESVEFKEPKANTTDPESRIVKNGKGYQQGYNAQAIVTSGQIIVAAEVTQDQNDRKQLHPMVAKAVENLKEVGEETLPKVALADAGYASEAAFSAPLPEGIEPIAAIEKENLTRTTGTPAPRGRIPKNASATDRMKRKLRTKRGKALYKMRGQTIEPVFGQIKSGQQQFDRFSRRGKSACDSEWKLVCAVHNLRKLWKTGMEKEERGGESIH